MKKKLKEEAIRLRTEERLSYSEIKERLDVAKSTLSYWLRDYPLSEEEIRKRQKDGWKKAQASRERYRNTMREKKEKKKKQTYNTKRKEMRNLPDSAFYVSGLILYHAEGGKTKEHRIKITNTDHRVLSFFTVWLERFLDIDPEKLSAELHLYEDMNIQKEVKFWKEKLGLNDDQFYEHQIREVKENSFTYPQSNRHGTCSIYYGSTEKKRELMSSIHAFLDIASEKM